GMKRSIDMTSDSGLISQDSDDASRIQEVLNELRQMQQTPQLVTSPEALEALEREIRQRTDRLGSLLVGHHMQQALDAVQSKYSNMPFYGRLHVLPSSVLRLVCRPIITHTHERYERWRLRERDDGLETPVGVYHRDCRSGTAAA